MNDEARAALLTEFGKLRRQHELRRQNPNTRNPAPRQLFPTTLGGGAFSGVILLPPAPQYDPLTYNSHLLTLLRMLRDDWHITLDQTTTTTTTTTFTFSPASFHPGLHPNIAQEMMPPIVSSPYPSLYDAVSGAVQYAVWYVKDTKV